MVSSKAYETGRGKIVVRSRTHIETIRGGREKIVVTEIPYDVNKAQMIKKSMNYASTKSGRYCRSP